MLALARNLLDHRVGQRDPCDFRRAFRRDLHDEQRLRGSSGRVDASRTDRTTHPDAAAARMLARVPRLAFRRTHPFGHPVDHRFEPGAQQIRQLAPHRQHRPVLAPPHRADPGASWRLCHSSTDGFDIVRASRARSTGATCGARAAHSPSDSSSARRTTDPSCSALRSPACAAAATAGRDSSARAVSSFSRTIRADSPSRPTVGSIWPRSSSTRNTSRSSSANRRCSRTRCS